MARKELPRGEWGDPTPKVRSGKWDMPLPNRAGSKEIAPPED